MKDITDRLKEKLDYSRELSKRGIQELEINKLTNISQNSNSEDRILFSSILALFSPGINQPQGICQIMLDYETLFLIQNYAQYSPGIREVLKDFNQFMLEFIKLCLIPVTINPNFFAS